MRPNCPLGVRPTTNFVSCRATVWWLGVWDMEFSHFATFLPVQVQEGNNHYSLGGGAIVAPKCTISQLLSPGDRPCEGLSTLPLRSPSLDQAITNFLLGCDQSDVEGLKRETAVSRNRGMADVGPVCPCHSTLARSAVDTDFQQCQDISVWCIFVCTFLSCSWTALHLIILRRPRRGYPNS